MEFVAGFLLPVVIILAGILQSKDSKMGEKESYKEPETVEVKAKDKLVEKEIKQEVETVNSSNYTHTVSGINKFNKVKDEEPFKYNINVIEGTINHYVSIDIIPNLDRSIVEIRQKVEKLSLMSEFVKIKAYISKKPTIYEEYSTPPVDYRNNTAIIRFPIDKKYQFYQFQYSVKGPFKEPEVIQIK